jgi:RHS repeat-associated protein
MSVHRLLGQLPQTLHRVIRLYYTTDHLGSVRELVDGSGIVRARYDYSPYGERTRNLVTESAVESDFGYTAHYTHAASDIVLAPYRGYDPATAKWLSRDPIEEEGGINLYGYVGNEPTGAIDPLGLKPGDQFPTMDAAGADALKYIRDTKKDWKQREYGNWITCGRNRGKTFFTYDEPVTDKSGKGKSVTYPSPTPPTAVGMFHNHTALSGAWENFLGKMGYSPEDFSDEAPAPGAIAGDKAVCDEVGMPNYLLTPSGKWKKYHPDPKKKLKGKVEDFGILPKWRFADWSLWCPSFSQALPSPFLPRIQTTS